MKLKCSGEIYTEPITPETCMACARDRVSPPCGYSYPLVKAITNTEEREGVHVTSVIGCLLRAYYDMVDEEPKYLHELLALWIGRAVHSDVENVLAGDSVESEVKVEHEGLQGRVDVIQDGHIIDLKTTRWMVPYQLPYGDHARQVSLYKRLTGADGKLYIQYVDLSGPSKCKSCKRTMELINGRVQCPQCGAGNSNSHLGARMIEIDPVNTDEYLGRAEVLRKAVEANAPPTGEPSWVCNYCSHVHKCPLGQIYLEAG